MKALQDIALSMLDLVAVREGGTVADALAIALRTARHAEALPVAYHEDTTPAEADHDIAELELLHTSATEARMRLYRPAGAPVS